MSVPRRFSPNSYTQSGFVHLCSRSHSCPLALLFSFQKVMSAAAVNRSENIFLWDQSQLRKKEEITSAAAQCAEGLLGGVPCCWHGRRWQRWGTWQTSRLGRRGGRRGGCCQGRALHRNYGPVRESSPNLPPRGGRTTHTLRILKHQFKTGFVGGGGHSGGTELHCNVLKSEMHKAEAMFPIRGSLKAYNQADSTVNRRHPAITLRQRWSFEQKCTNLCEDSFAIILGAGQAGVQVTGLLNGVRWIVC